MIVAVPYATEVTRPAVETVATPVLDELHVNVAPAIVLSFASFRVAVMVAVSLNDEKLKLVGASVIDVAVCVIDTVTVAVAVAEPDVAVIVAVPSATAVTRPALDTVATVESDELHVTLAPLIVAPFWSLTVAVS